MAKPLAIVLLVATVVCVGNAATAIDEFSPTFSITAKRDTDKVVASVEKGSTVFTIHSPFGISNAVIERTEVKWPDSMILRLHLKGLGNLRVTNGKVTLEASVSSHSAKSPVRLWMDKNEDAPLDTTSPYWMEIRMLGGDRTPANGIPLENGYFEMKLPKAFFDDNSKSITISWIDFYRR